MKTELRFDWHAQGARVFRVSQQPELVPDLLIGVVTFMPEGDHFLENGNQFAAMHCWLWADELAQLSEFMKKNQCTMARPAAL